MGSVSLSELTLAIAQVSEKAANIARVIRSEERLFELLVEEKTGFQKNKRFTQDFKTLADVFIQETVRRDLENQFKGIAYNIRGEESNTFTNTLGESITVELKETPQETAKILSCVLAGHLEASMLLAETAHEPVHLSQDPLMNQSTDLIDIQNLGIWIDPIDSTAQYIHGGPGVIQNGVYLDGLRCALILIGAYDLTTGRPIAGVINQPFFDHSNNKWTGRLEWGICYDGCRIHSIKSLPNINNKDRIVMSMSESEHIQNKLKSMGPNFQPCHTAGAGYKALCVIDQHVSAYLLTQGTTYKWDTCAPQAILMAQGGGICDYTKTMNILKKLHAENKPKDDIVESLKNDCQVLYNVSQDSSVGEANEQNDINILQNKGGIIGYINIESVLKIYDKLNDMF